MHNLFVSPNDDVPIRIGNFQIKNNEKERLLGIQFNKKLSFSYHLSEICKKASKKLYALGRVTAYMNLPKRKILMNAFLSNSVIVHLYGYAIVALLTKQKLTK